MKAINEAPFGGLPFFSYVTIEARLRFIRFNFLTKGDGLLKWIRLKVTYADGESSEATILVPDWQKVAKIEVNTKEESKE